MRHFLSLEPTEPADLAALVADAVAIGRSPAAASNRLAGKAVGIYFRRSSTRTRTAFSAGALRLGANIVSYGPTDLQTTTGETSEDTARVLAQYLDALVMRTNEGIEEMRAMSAQGGLAIINALSADEHPTQAVGDLATLAEEFGQLEGLHVLYVGEGNSTASALAHAVARTPEMAITFLTPEGYGLPEATLGSAREHAQANGSHIEQQHDLEVVLADVDAVYTSRWKTMGAAKKNPDWIDHFRPYKVTAELMQKVGDPARTIFLHDLPAVRGEDVDSDVLDGASSRAFRQAFHKMTSAMAILTWCLAEDAATP